MYGLYEGMRSFFRRHLRGVESGDYMDAFKVLVIQSLSQEISGEHGTEEINTSLHQRVLPLRYEDRCFSQRCRFTAESEEDRSRGDRSCSKDASRCHSNSTVLFHVIQDVPGGTWQFCYQRDENNLAQISKAKCSLVNSGRTIKYCICREPGRTFIDHSRAWNGLEKERGETSYHWQYQSQRNGRSRPGERSYGRKVENCSYKRFLSRNIQFLSGAQKQPDQRWFISQSWDFGDPRESHTLSSWKKTRLQEEQSIGQYSLSGNRENRHPLLPSSSTSFFWSQYVEIRSPHRNHSRDHGSRRYQNNKRLPLHQCHGHGRCHEEIFSEYQFQSSEARRNLNE